jgi:hypothetical protein
MDSRRKTPNAIKEIKPPQSANNLLFSMLSCLLFCFLSEEGKRAAGILPHNLICMLRNAANFIKIGKGIKIVVHWY